jgi:hypothetical protein
MRTVQLGLFILGVLSFLASAFVIGQVMGDVLWRAGVAAMLVDLVCLRLWPVAKNP